MGDGGGTLDRAMPTPLVLSPAARGFRPLAVADRPIGRRPIVAPLGRPPRAHIWQIGCQMNDADREGLIEQLSEIGVQTGVALEDADLAILITCTVRQNAEQKVFGRFKEMREWKAARPGRAIALTGCMAVEHGDALLDRLRDLDYLFDVREPDGFLAKLVALYHADLSGEAIPLPASDRLSAYVPVIGGCNEMCTYCIVPFVRGREQSRSVAEVVAHVQRHVDRGVKEITLLGQNVNSYDDGQGNHLPELMAAVDGVGGLERMRFLTSHPRNATPELFHAMADLPTACEQLHLPVQSGSNATLRRMRRLYTIEHYCSLIEKAREIIPNLAVSTDIIVGFCGETDEEFAQTEELMRAVRFDVVHLQAYSVRPGTAAARRVDDITTEVKKARLNHLLALQRDIAQDINEKHVGSTVDVLIEGRGEHGHMYGRTRSNRVAWLDENATAQVGQTVLANVTSATAWQLSAQPLTAGRPH